MDTTYTKRSRRGSSEGRRGNASFSRQRRNERGGQRRSRGGNGERRRNTRVQPTFDPSQFINTNPVNEVVPEYVPTHTFETFGLDGRLSGAMKGRGITAPTPIQDQVIPEILNGRDVIGLAETGTGKTAAFLLPILEKTLKEPSRQTLILAPTRELALQIEAELKTIAGAIHVYATVCVGGTNINPQIRGLRKKNHFIIGTPGRVLDLINQRYFKPEQVTTVVLDEADRMLDMGFIRDIRAIVERTPKDRETLFFSATMTEEAKNLVSDFLRDPVTISVKKRDVTASVEQDVVRFEHHAKFEKLTELLGDPSFRRVIVFGAMKHSVEKLARELWQHGIKAESIHGNKSHGQRQRSLAAFKSGHAQVLVATDVAARGIHVDGVTHVINYDLPNTFEDYVHRIGRTGRGTKRGKALTFVPTR